MAPKGLQLGFVGLALFTLAFGAQPQAVDVATHPGRGVPVQRAAALEVLVLQLVDDHCPVDGAVMYLVAGQRREGGAAVGVGDHGQGVRGWVLAGAP
jgi:hypothetical protein